jgi:hypothetical protein
MTPDAPELIGGRRQAPTSQPAAPQPPDGRVPTSRVVRAAKALLSDMERFSSLVLRRPLRHYQLEPLRAIVDSVLNRKGLEFLLIFPRQSGKNEAVAQLLVYLLNILQRVGGNIVYGATGDGLGLGIGRLEERLDNAWNADRWTKRVRPTRRCLGKAAVVLVSSHPMASARGQTAHWLLILDETQDQVGSHIEAVFTPMRAANNATALYIGTVKLTTDYLWVKKLELERETARDGIQRVWMVHPDQVTAENAAYQQFLDAQIRKHGRHHPIIASEYFLEPIDGAGGLFDARRQHLMRGSHPRIRDPETRRPPLYVATLDVGGQDEAATDPIAQLAHPGRDYTVATVFRVVWSPLGVYAPGPTYEALDVFVDHGSRHFEDQPGRPALVHRLAAWLQSWQIGHLVGDESGVGQGVMSWLAAALGAQRVTGYQFAGTGKKAQLGSLFLSLIETHRFQYWTGDQDEPGSDGWWFWQQVAACRYEVPPDGRFERDLRWEVPASHRTALPGGRGPTQPTHDDRLLSAALVAELDRLVREGRIALGTAESAVVAPADPLADLRF